MDFILLRKYDDYISAHIDLGRLESEGIRCWLKNENLVTIAPFLTMATGGIHLMVAESQAARALEILNSSPGN
jgi:hypothetical protein